MKRTTRPIVYVVREIERSGVTLRPSVSIESTASGAITYGVRLSARTLREAREGSEVEFRKLRRFAEKMRNGGDKA